MIDIKKIINEVLKENPKDYHEMAALFYKKVNSLLKKLDYPDDVQIRTGLIGRPRLVVIKKLKEPIIDAWNMKTDEDSIAVEIGSLEGFIDSASGLASFKFFKKKDELMKQKFNFYNLTNEEAKKALEIISTYIEWDVDDIRGPIFGAIIPLAPKTNTPNEEWNKKAKELLDKYDREYELQKQKRMKESEVVLNKIINMIKEKGFNYELVGDEKDKKFLKLKFKDFEIIKPKMLFFPLNEKDFKKIEEILDEFLKNYEILENIKNGKTNLLKCRDLNVKAFIRGNFIEVPKNLVGLIIGKGGENIKKLSNLVDFRLQIKEFPEIQTKQNIYINRDISHLNYFFTEVWKKIR